MRLCPRCSSEITDFDKVCPRCGIVIEENSSKNLRKRKKAEKKEQKKLLKLKKKQEKLEREKIETDFSQYKKKEYMSKKQAQNSLEYDVDENNEINIDTEDVEIIDKKTREMLSQRERQTYSVKKARGEYEPEKIEWWELYKLANRSFARRKIKKEVNKAAKIKPDYISKTKLLLLAVFFGWFGVHNFYAKNKKKGWLSLICSIIAFSFTYMSIYFPENVLVKSIGLTAVGLPGFIMMVIWLSDIVNIMFNTFKYRTQKLSFISKMNIETRAKLGAKYIDMELLQKPWWARMKVWFEKKKRNYADYRQERRQKLIEKEKAKQEKLDEQAKIDAEIMEYERKEEEKLNSKKIIDAIDKESLFEIQSMAEENKKEIKTNKPKTAKVKVSTKKKK